MAEFRRWYDNDPILSRSMRILEKSDDQDQIKMSINLIKIIIEHNIESKSFASIEDIMSAVSDGIIEKGNARWYDMDNTVRAAITMLENCSSEDRIDIAKKMAGMIVEKFNEDDEEDIDFYDEIEELEDFLDLDEE